MDKQKQIEEMYEGFLSYKFNMEMEKFSYKEMCEHFYNAGYRKIPDKAVVLTGKDLETLRNGITETKKNIRKETAEKFAERVKMAFYYEFDELIPSIMADKIDEIVKELTEKPKSESDDDCVCCGKYAGEGRQVCVNCEVKNGL